MALKLLQPGIQPLGQFDGLDSLVSGPAAVKGGEVVTFASILVTDPDLASVDVFDGYVHSNKRVVVTNNVSSTTKPLMLVDDGIAGYGTLFGSVVGGTVGKVTSGVVLGPHTAAGSGKLTCWDKPGLYAVSLDACDQDPVTGLQPTNAILDTGKELYATATTGVLTPAAAGGANPFVGRFVDFETNGSLVTTPKYLVSPVAKSYTFAVFYFHPNG